MIPTADSPDVFGNTVFCDDIRHEIDGKVSFIGAYQGGMQVHVPFPATIPKFAFGISLFQRRSAFEGKISLRVYLPGDEDENPSVESQLDAPLPPPTDPSQGTPFAGGPFIAMRAYVTVAGMVIKAPGAIKVRALRGGVLFPIGALGVLQATPETPTPTAPT